MVIDLTTVKPLLEKALNLMETASLWERKAAKKCHMIGLQGEKRRMRWLSREARNIVDKIEHSIVDRFDLDISAQLGSVDVSAMVDHKTSMDHILEKLWTIRNQTHQLGNDLVVANYRFFAKFLYKYSDWLFDIIGEMQRNYKSYQMANWEWHHISRYQETFYNIHDVYEDKEKSQGYSDD